MYIAIRIEKYTKEYFLALGQLAFFVLYNILLTAINFLFSK